MSLQKRLCRTLNVYADLGVFCIFRWTFGGTFELKKGAEDEKAGGGTDFLLGWPTQ